jgi:8-oxo-dGTP pyrophosphatase MutT (NUDIX family)
MWEVIQSAWGIVYYIDENWQPKYLLIKRHALSGKIERVAPKGKIQAGEDIQQTALREVSEETGIPINQMKLKWQLWVTQLRNIENQKWQIEKDVTYFLMQYIWDPWLVNIQNIEWYVGLYKRATLNDVLWLIYYKDIRELIRKSYNIIKDEKKTFDIKKNFIAKLDL